MAGVEEADDGIRFAEEEPDPDAAGAHGPPWTVLIADDDPEVHAITRMVLASTVFRNRPVRFLSARSAAEARIILAAEPDVAVILLDVVMETDDAGLRLVRHIREELGNRLVRIVLRTGQPGQAPERHVILHYDIDDYKAKSELTAQKLFTATVAGLRSYMHLTELERNRRGLERVLDAAAALFDRSALDRFADRVVAEMESLTGPCDGALLCAGTPDGPEVIAASGAYAGAVGRPLAAVAPPELARLAADALDRRATVHGERRSAVVFRSRDHRDTLLAVDGHAALGATDRSLIAVLARKVAIGFDNAALYERLRSAERATVHALGKLAEYKDEATGDHVRRIGRFATAVACELRDRGVFPERIDEEFCAHIGLASMLHDVGKVGIPDRILRKAGALDPAELEIMRSHAGMGARILGEAAAMAGGRGYLGLGAEIAGSHHERFDGSGYPRGLAGEGIPLAGRIVAVVDVYDALLHNRPYKQAWDRSDVIDLIRRESGRHFDPRVVEAFLAVLARGGP